MASSKPLIRMTEGRALIIERQWIVAVASLVRDGILYRTRSLGKSATVKEVELRDYLDDAARKVVEDEASWQPGMPSEPGLQASVENRSEVIGVAEAAKILNRPRRTVLSWAHELGGEGGGRGRAVMLSRELVEARAVELKDAVA